MPKKGTAEYCAVRRLMGDEGKAGECGKTKEEGCECPPKKMKAPRKPVSSRSSSPKAKRRPAAPKPKASPAPKRKAAAPKMGSKCWKPGPGVARVAAGLSTPVEKTF